MSLLVRKINRAKWTQAINSSDNDVSADAITSCLRTSRNSLSVWKIDSEENLEKTVIALVSNQDHLDTIDVVTLEEDALRDKKLEILKSEGVTEVHSLIDSHRNIVNLTYSGLGLLKDHILERIREKHINRFTKADLKQLLIKSIDRGLLKKDALKESIQNSNSTDAH